MVRIELINLTQWDGELVRHVVAQVFDELKLKRSLRFLFQERWTPLDDETGEAITGDDWPVVAWDGDAWEMSNGGFVRICLAPTLKFPLVWNINPELPGQYLRQVTWFRDAKEMFLYLASHELRHLWQFEHEAKLNQICKLLKIDDETDADIFALQMLSRYRQNPDIFAFAEGSLKKQNDQNPLYEARIAAMASRALSKCPWTSWKAAPIYDYSTQRYAMETMQYQLREQALSAKDRVSFLLTEWCKTGKWPRARNAPIFFLREILLFASLKNAHTTQPTNQPSLPPWASEETTAFIKATFDRWYEFELPQWVEDSAKEAFDLQESLFSGYHPLE